MPWLETPAISHGTKGFFHGENLGKRQRELQASKASNFGGVPEAIFRPIHAASTL